MGDMDLEDQATEIKQEVDEINEIVSTSNIKSEQAYPNYGVQYDGIKIEEVTLNKHESDSDTLKHEYIWMEAKEEDTCEAEIKKNIENSVDAVDQVKTEDQTAVEVKAEKPEKEPYMFSTKFEDMDTSELNEEFDIKSECDPSLSDPALDSAAEKWRNKLHMEAERKLFVCYNCNYTACSKMGLIQHSVGKCNITSKLVESQIAKPLNVYVCTQCNMVFKKKTSLDDHIIKKHIESIASISSKIHKCTDCDYKTTDECNLGRHNVVHSRPASKPNMCQHCNTLLKSKQTLDNHIILKHSDFIASVKRKIYECSYCTYKTVFRQSFKKHLLMHSRIGSSSKLSNQHVSPRESEGELFVCYNCNYTAHSKMDLIQHISVGKCYSKTDLAESKQPWTEHFCTQCNMVFKKKMSLDDHIIKKHTESIASISSKVHECTHCNYKTTKKTNITRHMLTHPSAVSKFSICEHCNASFNSALILDNHIIKKHPEFMASIKRKILECSYCTYKTTVRHYFNEHTRTHSSGDLSKCKHCNATFKSKRWLDGHIVKQHPEFITSVTSKIHECSYCTYKTTHKCNFDEHILIHSNDQLSRCKHCTAIFKSNKKLESHIVKKHPDFSALVSCKIHCCTNCDYKTTKKGNLDRHMLKHLNAVPSYNITCKRCNATYTSERSLNNHIIEEHPDLISSIKLTECKYCTALFKSKYYLDDHIVKKHPEFIAYVTSQIHKCSYCKYKTTIKRYLGEHMKNHSSVDSSDNLITCIHCTTTFKSKYSLDDHIVKKHPEFFASVSRKIYECSYCTYKTIRMDKSEQHMLAQHRHRSQ